MAASHELPSLPTLAPLELPDHPSSLPDPPIRTDSAPFLQPIRTDSAPFLQSPTPSFAESFSTAFTSPSHTSDSDVLDSPSALSPASPFPTQSLRKSLSVDSFVVQYGQSSPGPRPNRGNTSSAVDPPQHHVFSVSSGLRKERERDQPSRYSRNRGVSVGSNQDAYDSPALADSDVERYEPLSSPVERFRRASLKGHDLLRRPRGGELPLPSRVPTLSTASSVSSVRSASTATSTSGTTLEDTSRPPVASSSLQSLPPRRGTSFSVISAGRTRSGSLGVYTPYSGKRMAVNTSHDPNTSSATVTLAVVGTKDCGKSSVIRKGLNRLSQPQTIFASRAQGLASPCYTKRTTQFTDGSVSFPLHVVEVDIPPTIDPSTPYDLAWPDDQPPIDGVLICYDSSIPTSFQPVEGLIQTCLVLKKPIIVLACKVDLECQIEPEKALEMLQRYDVGLIEVTTAHDGGKNKIRQSFDFLLKAILRERRGDKVGVSDSDYKNPASPDVIAHPPPWENSRTSTPTASSPAVSVKPVSPTHVTARLPSQSPPSSSSHNPLPNTPTRIRSMGDLLPENERSKASASHPDRNIVPEPEYQKSSGESAEKSSRDQSNGTQPAEDRGESKENKKSRPAQWATLEELLDKLLFLAVSGDDPTFISHFLLTYRRFATPRTVLLAMQKRMRQLDNPCGDPMFACFAQMRICHLLQTWMDSYPHDFAVKGTQGALNALVKSIISKTHLLHYGSEFLPFLEMVPGLVDHDAPWALKADVSADESDDSYSLLGEDEEEVQAFEKDSSPQRDSSDSEQLSYSAHAPLLPLRERKASLPLPKSLITPRSMVNGAQAEGADPSAKQLIRDLFKLSQEVMMLDPEEIAQEITKLELKLFLDIKPRHWLYFTFVSGKKDESEPITAFNAVSNHLADWVVSLILCHDKPRARARQIEKFVEIAQRLRALNNYSALRAFVAGINNSSFAGDETMEQFKVKSPEQAKNLRSWDLLLQQIGAHRAYRLALRNTKGACIPALEVHMSDLIRAHEGNEDLNQSDPSKIHWGKFNMMGRFISSTTQCQAQCENATEYSFTERKHIRELIARPVMNAEVQKSRISHDETDDDYRPPISNPNQPKDVAVLRKLFFW